MYIFTNALENIARNKGRNILMGAIIFAIIATTVVALIINNTADNVIASYKDRFSSEVSISPDMQKVMEEAQKNATADANGRTMLRMMRPEIETEQLLQFTDSEYLKESTAYLSMGANSDGDAITALDQDDSSSDSSSDQGASISGMGGMMVSRVGGMDGNFRLYGDYWQDFSDGLRSIESGAMPQNDGECVISSELATLNNISVGDKLSMTANLNIAYDPDSEEYAGLEDGDIIIFNDTEYAVNDAFMGGRASREVKYELTVVGIYADLTDEYANENIPKMANLNRRNEILTTFNTLISERKQNETGIEATVKYYLKSPDLLDAFEAEVRAKGLSDMFSVSTDTASYERIVKPVEGLKGISLAFMIIVLVLGAIIVILLSTMAIRERKYEIGVLRAMGMKKSKVALSLWSEMIALTCVCLIVGIAIGSAVSQPITDSLLQMQIESEEQNNQNQGSLSPMTIQGGMRIGGGNMTGGTSNAQPLSEMKINVGFTTILEIIVISLFLASVAGIASISRITKYEPIKILMERN